MIHVHFAGGSAGIAPLTWGQRAIWPDPAAFDSPHQVLNLPRTLRVPDRADASVAQVATALGRLVERHSSLRTRFLAGPATVRQRVSASGTLPVRVRTVAPSQADPDGAHAARNLVAELAAADFDHRQEWPLRVALLQVGTRVRQVALVFSHAVVDFHAVEIVLRDLRLLLLRGAVPAPAGWQSVEVAAHEQHQEVARSDRAARYWLDQFARFPGEMFPAAAGPVPLPRHRVGRLVSAAVDTAARLIAARYRVSTATVLLAAIAAEVTKRSGLDRCGLVTMSSNRFRPRYDTAVASLNQIGLCHLDLPGRSAAADQPGGLCHLDLPPGPDTTGPGGFAELLTRTWQASLSAYRHAYYDPLAMAQAFAAAGHDLASALAPYCFVNDLRLPHEPGPMPTIGPGQLLSLTRRSMLSWDAVPARFAWRCRFQVMDAPDAVALVVTADTAYLPPGDVERLLLGVEATLVAAANAGS